MSINLTEKIQTICADKMSEIANDVKNTMVSIVNVDTGNLRDHIAVYKENDYRYFIGTTDVFYAKWVNSGRGPVRPVNAPYLVFNIKGKTIRTKYARPYAGSRYVQKTASKFK